MSFMEGFFDKYRVNERIMSIAGYSWPIIIPKDYKYDIYFTYRSGSWGWGTWKRAWQHFDRKANLILDKINKSSLLRERVNQAGKDLIPMLRAQINGNINSWAIFWTLNIVMNDGICINPVRSLIKNIGFDGTGVHCGKSNRFDVDFREIYSFKKISFPPEICFKLRITNNCNWFFNV